MKEKDILKEIERTEIELVKLKKKAMSTHYDAYEPWEELEKLKSVHLWDDLDEDRECPSSIRVREAQHEARVTDAGMPGMIWGMNVGQDD